MFQAELYQDCARALRIHTLEPMRMGRGFWATRRTCDDSVQDLLQHEHFKDVSLESVPGSTVYNRVRV